ncbi:hypothetical protein MIR68_000669 [Amoeboaphelidium protococcarum]|nr:hypothetical protein MIR68_000669 [Amoeboaphelidium protococcarum]
MHSMSLRLWTATLFSSTKIAQQTLDEIKQLLLQSSGCSVGAIKEMNADGTCVEIAFQCDYSQIEVLRQKIVVEARTKHGIDFALQEDNVFRKYKRLVVFDMDSTLIQQEVIDELARCVNVVDQVSAITERAMNGEIDFKESLRQRVALLDKSPVNVIDIVRERITFTPGVKELCAVLKTLGYKLAVLSGGFQVLADYVKSELNLDYAFANHLEVSSDGKLLTGRTNGTIVDAERKADLLQTIAKIEGVRREQIIAVGDGANDLLMLQAAGLGVAFNAKPKVQKLAQVSINQKNMLCLLHLLGLTTQYIEDLQKLN